MVNYVGRKILVTGGTGFIGGRLAERLAVEEQAKVRVLVHDWRKAVWVSRANIELVQGDIMDPSSVARAMKGCEIVFHCVGVGGSMDQCMSINCDGTRNVLECAMEARVERFVYLSTCVVHGPNPPDHADETQGFHFTGSSYGDSKIAAEKVVWQFWREQRLRTVIIRPFPVWGPRSPAFTLWPVSNIKHGRWFLIGGGHGTCQAVYIDNLIDSLLLAGVKPDAVGEAFLIADEEHCTWGEFFNHYARMVGIRELPSVRPWTVRFALQSTAHIDGILRRINGISVREPARTLVYLVRKGVGLIRRLPARYAVFDPGDLVKYTYEGMLNTSKSRSLLQHTSRVSMEEGMRETEIWLRDQKII